MLKRSSGVFVSKPNPFARPPPASSRGARAPSRVATFADTMEGLRAKVLSKEGKFYTFCNYVWSNMGGLTAYQLVLEGLVTAYFYAGLQSRQFTTEGLHRIFVEGLQMSEGWVGIADAHYSEDYVVPGTRKVIPKEQMTNVHTAHNVAMALIPLQFLFIAVTFPLVKSSWVGTVYPALAKTPVISSLLRKPTMPNEFADKVMWATAQKRKEEMARQAVSAKPSKKTGFRK